MTLTTRAPAKINLNLSIQGRRFDGYHELTSLVAFAGVGDGLVLTTGNGLTLSISGPHASRLEVAADNLVLHAARHLAALKPGLRMGHFHLVKRLPVASGIGGGSADAAAALRLLARLNQVPPDDPALAAAARLTGADVPVCLSFRPRIMAGMGDELGPVLKLPRLFAVLVNPGVAVATTDVFGRLGLEKGGTQIAGSPLAPLLVPQFATAQELVEWLAGQHNDLEPPALAIAPVIGDVLAALRGAAGCKLARMSGSGATCFGLFADCTASAMAAQQLHASHPGWWVKATVLR